MKLTRLFKKSRLNQYGFSHIEVGLGLIVVLIVALVGVRTLENSRAEQISSSDNASMHSLNIKAPAPLKLINGKMAVSAATSKAQGYYLGGAYYYWDAMAANGPISAKGASAEFTQSQPKVNVKDLHSITELWLSTPDERQAVEIGWQVFSDQAQPELWVSNWVNGIPCTINIANSSACGFVAESSTITPGLALQTGKIGKFSAKFTNNKWAFLYNGTEFGYFPESLWSGSFTQVSIAETYGEVESFSQTNPETQMGNGVLGSGAHPDVIKNFNLIGDTDSPSGFTYSSLGSDKYAVANYDTSCLSSCGMSFGGPGYAVSNNPYVNITSTMVGTTNTVTLAGFAAATQPPGTNTTINSATINWGDGTTNTYQLTPIRPNSFISDYSESHTYTSTGTYKLSVKVVDSNGLSKTTTETYTLLAG